MNALAGRGGIYGPIAVEKGLAWPIGWPCRSALANSNAKGAGSCLNFTEPSLGIHPARLGHNRSKH